MKSENFDYVIQCQRELVASTKTKLLSALDLDDSIENWSIIDKAISDFVEARHELHGMELLLNLSEDEEFLKD